MNTIELQSIVFIYGIGDMFFSTLLNGNGQKVDVIFPTVSVHADEIIILCSISKSVDDELSLNHRQMYSHILDVGLLVQKNPDLVKKIYLVLPPDTENGSFDLRFKEVKKVSTVNFEGDGFRCAFFYETFDGEEIRYHPIYVIDRFFKGYKYKMIEFNDSTQSYNVDNMILNRQVLLREKFSR